jgi:hypothetical protein
MMMSAKFKDSRVFTLNVEITNDRLESLRLETENGIFTERDSYKRIGTQSKPHFLKEHTLLQGESEHYNQSYGNLRFRDMIAKAHEILLNPNERFYNIALTAVNIVDNQKDSQVFSSKDGFTIAEMKNIMREALLHVSTETTIVEGKRVTTPRNFVDLNMIGAPSGAGEKPGNQITISQNAEKAMNYIKSMPYGLVP